MSVQISNKPGTGGSSASYYYQGSYPNSALNYWVNAVGTSAYADYSTAGTIPAVTSVYNVGFGTPALPASNYPGVTFTAPATGTVEVSFIFNHQANANTATSYQIFESSTSYSVSTLHCQSITTIGSATMVGFLAVTAGNSYTVKLRAATGANTLYIGNALVVVATAAMLTVVLRYP